MSLYADTRALVSRYLGEASAATADAHLASDDVLVTARLTIVEVRRSLARALRGQERADATKAFREDLDRMVVLELDAATCDQAASIAEVTGVRSLDALHLAAAQRVGATTFLTFDLRQAQAARTLGLTVVGA